MSFSWVRVLVCVAACYVVCGKRNELTDGCEKAITEILVECGQKNKGEPIDFQQCIGPATPLLEKAGCAQVISATKSLQTISTTREYVY
jgi:hypothetical protein